MSSKYISNELSGIKIAHDFEDFIEDQEIILNIADKPIINNQNEIEDDFDVLENFDMKKKFENEYYKEVNTKIKNNSINYIEDRYDQEKKLLPQYDEMKPEKKGIILDDEGNFDLSKINKLDVIKKKLKIGADSSISLEVEKKIASEYEKAEKAPLFKRPTKKKEKKDALDLINFLEGNQSLNDTKEHGLNKINTKLINQGARGSQRVQNSMINNNSVQQDKLNNYNIALEKAREEAQLTKLNNQKNVLDVMMEDEEDQLQQSLERQRKIIQSKSTVEDVVKNYIDENRKIEEKTNSLNEENFSKITIDIKRNQENIEEKEEIKTILTSTEFLKNLRTDRDVKENQQLINGPSKLSIKDSKEGITSVVNVPLPSERLISYSRSSGYESLFKKKTTLTEITTKNKNDDDQIQYDENDLEKNQEQIEDEIGFLEEESFGSGIAGALKKLRERGDLEMTDIDYSGRAKDKLPHEELAKFGPAPSDKIKLEYRDRNGKLMTQKEAFRYMCWTFHGKKPSKRKQEKKIKKEQLAINPRNKNVGETPLMKAFNRVQTKSDLPYIVLSQTKQDQP